MIIKTKWVDVLPLNELHLSANPENRNEVEKIISGLVTKEVLQLINPVNNRNVKVEFSKIISIESYTQMSIVRVFEERQEYYINKRLKELDFLNRFGLFRVNNSVMINIKNVQSFQVIENARMDVVMKDNSSYVVSRHYAKKIKEELTCSSI